MTPADDHLIDLDLPAVPESAPLARRAVAEALEGVPVDRDGVAGMVSEAVANSALHAYPEGSEGGRVRVSATLAGDSLDVVVADDGVEVSAGAGTRVTARFELFGAAGPHGRTIPREPFGGRARKRLARLLRRS